MLRAACGHILDGIDQHKLAFMYGVNQGRINEAVKAIEYTLENHRDIYAVVQGKARIVHGEKTP
jgi:hypothetical protein